MRIAVASVNGVLAHLPELLLWLREREPDVVALQKIRISEERFPRSCLQHLGYWSEAYGRSGEYGVAILSRKSKRLGKPTVLLKGLPGAETDGPRFLTAAVGGLWFASLYAPFGARGAVSAIQRRVGWLRLLRKHVHCEGYGHRDVVLCGDFNVKPDVKFGSNGPSVGTNSKARYSKAEQDELKELLNLGFDDLYRRAHPDPVREPGFTFGFHRKVGGTSRLHLAIANKRLARHLRCAFVDTDLTIRKEAAPLVIDLEAA